MEQEPIIINGIHMPPGCRKLTTAEHGLLKQWKLPQETFAKVRYYAQETLIFEPTPAYVEMLERMKADEKDLRLALHNKVHEHGLWAHSSKPSGASKHLPRVSVLLRPPFLESELHPSDRLKPRPREVAYVLHFDERHTLDAIRTTRRGVPVDREVAEELYLRKRAALRQTYGEWENMAQILAQTVIGVREGLVRSLLMEQTVEDPAPGEERTDFPDGS
ncbi:MAG: hypothetical protein Q7R81_00670 [Candidatus Peregrinibacteria bacterium]|nr:hypothetical protein [Candidatus Peregrinibacteria bacterium]